MKLRSASLLRTCRMEKRYTQRDLGHLSRCSHTTIHLLETGRLTTVKPKTAALIARHLGVPSEVLFEPRQQSVGSSMPTASSDGGRAA